MDIEFPMSPNAVEAHLNANATVTGWLDALFPVEAPAKGTGMFSSDCCGSNNYPEEMDG